MKKETKDKIRDMTTRYIDYIDWWFSHVVTAGIAIITIGSTIYLIYPKQIVGLVAFYSFVAITGPTFLAAIVALFLKTATVPQEPATPKDTKTHLKELLGGISVIVFYTVVAALIAATLDVRLGIKFDESRYWALILSLMFGISSINFFIGKLKERRARVKS